MSPSLSRNQAPRSPIPGDVRADARLLADSITLVHDRIAAGLVDEYRLFVYPVVLGQGRRLFADASGIPRLRLVESRPFRSGIVLFRYRTE